VARPLRYLPPDCPLVEVTCRTIQGRMLLRPSRELTRRIVGVLARAAARHEVGVCSFNYLSNHCHLLLRPISATELAAFMTYLNSNIAREAGPPKGSTRVPARSHPPSLRLDRVFQRSVYRITSSLSSRYDTVVNAPVSGF
jgi:REP element-mobilizing transposase RayT